MGIRLEKVVLELDDSGFSTKMARDAAVVAALNRELDSLSKHSVKSSRATQTITRDVDRMSGSVGKADRSINQLTGRLRLFADVAAIFGPSLAPIGAVVVPAVTGLASQLGFAAVAAGTAVVAFQGVGDALEAVNKAALEPTADNLDAARVAMDKLTPQAQGFVQQIRLMLPELQKLQQTAAAGLLPGVTEGLEQLEGALPAVERILASVSSELGDIAADTGASLASDRWAQFLDFLATEAPSALSELSEAVGNTVHAMAGLWMAFDPLNDDFSDWLVDATDRLDEWAHGLAQTEGFAEFVDYIRTNGPQVAETLGSIGSAVVEIIEAVAPLGGPSLKILEAFADVIGSIADSGLGTPIFGALAGLAAYNRALSVTGKLTSTAFGSRAKASITGFGAAITTVTSAQDRARLSVAQLAEAEKKRSAALRGGLATIGKSAAAAGGLAIAATGAADGIGLTNTASLALMGTIAGPWGAAIGGGVGLVMDMKDANEQAARAVERWNSAMGASAGNLTGQSDVLKKAKQEAQDYADSGFWDRVGANIAKGPIAVLNPFASSGFDDQLAERVAGVRELERQAARTRTVAQQMADALNVPLTEDASVYEIDAFLADLTPKLNKAGFSIDDLTSDWTGMTGVVAAWKVATQDAAVQVEQHMEQVRESTKQTSDSFRGLGKSLNDPEVSLGDWLKELRKQAKALEDFAVNTRKAHAKGLRLEVIDQLAAEGAEGAMRLQQLVNDTGTAIDDMNRIFERGEQGAADLQAAMDELHPPPPITPTVYTDPAKRDLATLSRLLHDIPDETVWVNVKRRGDFGNLPEIADGGTVPGPRWPYADKTLAMLAPGEEVITNRHGEADRFRADRAAGRIPAYADGGKVQATRVSVPVPAAMTQRTAAPDPGFAAIAVELRALRADVKRVELATAAVAPGVARGINQAAVVRR